MAPQPLTKIPSGSNVFIDANVFVYALNGVSAQCRQLLERCSREEITGITLFEIVNEATHRFMLAEATSKGLISKENARELRKKDSVIRGLTDYWQETVRILSLNLIFLSTDEEIVRRAQLERNQAGLLTNDSMVVSCMRQYGVDSVASADSDFDRATGVQLFAPNDLP